MKKLLVLCLCVCSLGAVRAQSRLSSSSKLPVYNGIGAEIYFDKLFVDIGNVKLGDVLEKTIVFTNIGKKPLILDDVISSCDCTTLKWTKEPVMPGKQGTIKMTYLAKTTGLISKRLTVLSNANTDRVILQIKGDVQ